MHGVGAWMHGIVWGLGKVVVYYLGVKSQCYATWIGEAGLGDWERSGLSGVWLGGLCCVKCEIFSFSF